MRSELSEREVTAFEWTRSSIRAHRRFELYAFWRITMFELARYVHKYRGGADPVLGKWLNLWGRNPRRPLSAPDGLTEEERARMRAPSTRSPTI